MSNLLVVKDKVQRYAKELFEQVKLGDEGELLIPFGTTCIFVQVGELSDDDERVPFKKENDLSLTWIRVYAPVLLEVNPTNDLYKWVATEGQMLEYGSYRVFTDEVEKKSVLEFSYTLPGDSLDPGEFKNAVLAVLGSSDLEDEDLQKKFGGKLFSEYVA